MTCTDKIPTRPYLHVMERYPRKHTRDRIYTQRGLGGTRVTDAMGTQRDRRTEDDFNSK